jgi:hypothetical protein
LAVLFGHPSGNPFSHHAALAHFEAGRLGAFCVPWMPSAISCQLLQQLGKFWPMAGRLSRRHFHPLSGATKVQGRIGEFRRLFIRALGMGDEHLSQDANDWLMRTMFRECQHSDVTAVHAYEDCSLTQFVEAARRGKACIYDMPIGYYPAWEKTQASLAKKYAEWLKPDALQSLRHVRRDQKRQEMQLADLTLVPSTFVEKTIRMFHPNKAIAQAPYGVDIDFWSPGNEKKKQDALRFIYAGSNFDSQGHSGTH